MNKNMLNQILKDRKRKTRSLALILCLSMIVSLGTFAGFHKTASAKVYTREVLDCPYTYEGAEPVAHVHNDDCYEGETLVCTLPEREAHTHTDECFTEQRVLVCGLEENPGHQHSEECYDENGELICQIPEGEGAHAHTEECYSTERVMICDKQELPVHVHDAGCFHTEEISVDEPEETVAPEQAVNTIPEMPVSDPNADLETVEDWNREFENFELSGNWARDLVLVAATQQGRGESPNNFEAILNDAGDAWVTHGYTRYGAWYGVPYAEEWSAMFVSFCLRYAGIPEENVPNNPTAALMAESFSKGELFAGRDYVPAAGDLIFFDTVVDDEITNIDHMGIVYHVDVEDGTINTVEGSRTDAVATFGYNLDDDEIVGYGILPQNPDFVPAEDENEEPESVIVVTTEEEEKKENEETTDTKEETVPAISMPAQSWERTAGGIKVTVDAPEGAFPENTRIAVTPVNGNSLKDTVSDAVNGEVLEVQAVDITFFDADGREIEPAVPIRVVMTPAATENAEEKTSVVHVDIAQQTAELVEQAVGTEFDNSEVVFDADAFTIYAIVYTYQVEYEYEVDGKTFTSSMPGAENMTLTQIVEGLGIVDETEIDTFVSKIVSIASSNEEVAVVNENNEIRVLKDGEAKIVITMQDGAKFHIDVRAEGETSASNETATVSTKGDLYLPADAELKTEVLDEVKSESAIAAVEAQEGTADSNAAAAETAYQVFDISLEHVRPDQYKGFQVEVTLPEDVVGRDFHLYHVHDGETTEIELNTVSRPADDTGLEVVSGFAFETKDFSEFVLKYTVDFTYEGRTWSFPGQGSYRLADVLAVLGIEGSIDDAALTLIMGEDHAGALYLTQADGEYYINSDIAFTDTYELRVRSAERVYLISVTDTQTSADLSDFLKNAVITGAIRDSDGKYHVEKGKEYTIYLTFAENSAFQFNNTETLTYQMPAGIIILSDQIDDGTVSIVYQNKTYQVDFHYELKEDGSLKIIFDQSDPDFPRLQDSTNVSFRFSYTGQFDGAANPIEFNDVIERDIIFNEPEPGQAYVSKNGTFDETTGTYHYTVKVTASGAVKNVRVKDVISGNVLIVNNDVQVTGNSSSYTDHGATNGFDYTFASMQEGEEITINYSAKIDPSKIPANGKVTADMTRNTVTVTPDDGPPHNASYSHEINLKKPDKNTGVESGTTADGKKLYKWTIDYNTLALAKAGGDTVSDSIGESSRQYMKYHGDVVVKVYGHSGNLVDTRSFTPSTDYTWTYTVPDADTTPYRYVFEYETEVDQAAIDLTGSSVKLNNDSEGPGGKDSEDITIGPKESTSITKEVVSSNEQEITWISHIHVPESGLSKAVVTDTLPYIYSGNLGLSGNYMLYDLYKAGSLEITGLDDQETYTVDAASPDKIVITFFKDSAKTESGLNSSAGGRDITVKLTTTVNQDWLKAGYNYPTSYQSFHTNNININGGKDVQAQVKYIEPSIEKSGLSTGKGVYKYTIYVTHVDSSPIVVNDKFDTSLLEVDTSLDGHDWNYQSMYITGGDYPGHVYSGDTSVKVDYSDTTDGIQITANNVPLQSNGQFYPTYMITYFLKLKEGVDLEQLAIANGGKHDLTNTAVWNDHEDSFTFTTTYDYLDKKLLNEGQLGSTNRKAQYQITFNPGKATLNNGEPMTMTDVMSANLSMDYSSIRIVTDPPGQTVPYSLSGGKNEEGKPDGTTIGTYTIPDWTKVVITYDALVIGTGPQTIVNKVSVNDIDETETTTKSYGSATEGLGAVVYFKIVKVDGYDANKKLAGVKFKVSAMNQNVYFDEEGTIKEIFVTTDDKGEAILDGHKYKFFFNEKYYVQEVEAPENYGIITFPYEVTLTNNIDDVDYGDGQWIYYFNDTKQIKNWPLEGLVVEKQVESPDNSDKEQYYRFRVSILKDNGQVDTSYNEKNGDDQFVNGSFEFELKDKEQKKFWGFAKGTKYIVEEIDSKGLTVSFTYSTYDEDGKVIDTITVNDKEHTGTLTQENEVIIFKNSREQKGALKLKKLVTVNGTATTGILANGDYTFTVTGPGTSTTVNKTVTIKVENGVATKYKIDDATTYTDLPEDKFVLISDLTPGEYTITETGSTNTNVTLASITGGKDGTVNVQNKQVTVTVTAGDTIAAAATATFTNNLEETTEIEGTKTWVTARVHSDPVLILRRVPSDTTPAPEPETVMAADGNPLQPSWTENRYKYENLPKYNEDGKKYTYTVAETGFTITEGNAKYVYTVDAKGNVTATPEGAPTFVYSVDQSGLNFTNAEPKEFEFAKVWTTNGTSVYQPWPDNVAITVTLTRTGGNGASDGGTVIFTVTKDAITPSTSDSRSDFAFKAAMISAADHVYTYKITGLDALWKNGKVNGEWTYSITETPVPGYNSPKYFKEIADGWSDSHGQTAEDGMRIVNDQGGYELPQTGGIGTTLFTALGGLMTATAGAILTIKRKRKTA